ncbi:hypothetical protein QQF64_034622 [Cirrhinus molitorella]|uniref:Uncharacterized protein n=1 Tax=Cirrhinus molitorella TaxID=172907 RepID=A0ABR3L0Y2_9TELE
MDGRRRKYTAPGSEYEIPSRTKRYWKRRKLTEAINMHQSNQETNLDQDSSDHDSDSGSEDAHDGGGITQNLHQDSSDHDSNSGSEDAHDGGGITNLHQDSSDNRSENAHDVDDITSLHADPESNELPPNLSQTTESSIFSFEDSVDFGVFEPLWQSFSDSESIGSGEEFPMEDSTDKPTCLVNIPHFDLISGMPPDHMHNVHLELFANGQACGWIVNTMRSRTILVIVFLSSTNNS